MIEKNLDYYIELKEGTSIELKKAKSSLPKSIWETYSAFANTCGGKIFLGIEEGNPNEIIGVSNLSEIKKDFYNTINNPSKVSKNILKETDYQEIKLSNGLVIIEINVPEASVYDKPIYINGNILNSFKRNYEGDYKIDQYSLSAIVDDAKSISNDSLNNKLNIGYEAVDIKTLDAFRKDLNESNPENILKLLSNEEFLIQMGYLNPNPEGDLVLSNAALLLFTTPAAIKRIYQGYFLDYQEKDDNEDFSWVNRVTSDDIDYVGNLYNFYKRVLKLLWQEVPKPFYLEGFKDTGEENIRFMIREGFLNAITNSDYSFNASLKIIKTRNRIEFINDGRLKIPYDKAIKYGNSDPRNKSLMSTFRNLKACDRGGSGLPRIFMISEKLHLYRPMLIDNGVENKTNLIIYLKKNSLLMDDNSTQILKYLEANPAFISIKKLSDAIGINRTTVSKIVNILINDGIIITNGLTTKGKMVKLK